MLNFIYHHSRNSSGTKKIYVNVQFHVLYTNLFYFYYANINYLPISSFSFFKITFAFDFIFMTYILITITLIFPCTGFAYATSYTHISSNHIANL